MSFVSRLRALARRWLRRNQVERDLHDELQAYADLVADSYRQRGVAEDEAAVLGRKALGTATSVAQAVRERRTGAGVETFVHDVRYACRGLRRAPGFAITATLTLGLAIGVTTTIFAVADAALFKPLPYRTPEGLVEIAYVLDRGTATERRMMGLSSWRQLDQWRAETSLFEGIELVANPRQAREVGGITGAIRYIGAFAPGVPGLLGVAPLLGRTFSPADVSAGSNPILLSEDYWRQDLGANRDVPGTALTIDGQPYVVLGVMPATLRWAVGGERGVIGWTLLDEQAERATGGRKAVGEVARLREGLSIPAANGQIAGAVARIQSDTSLIAPWDVEIHPLDSRESHFGSLRLTLLFFLGATGCLLLVPCANVSGLLLARGLERQGELALRSALGASRARLMRQLLTEVLLISLLGGAVGLLLTWWSLTLIPRLIPPQLPVFAANPLTIDLRVLGACLVAVFAATLLGGLIPALRHSTHRASDLVGHSLRTVGDRRQRLWHQLLQGSQVALVVLLLSAQTLLASSFIRLVTVDPGFDAEGLVRLFVSVPESASAGEATTVFFETLLTRVRTLPGVTAAILGNSPAGELRASLSTEGSEKRFYVDFFNAAPDYFAMVGIPLVTGRAFSPDDRQASAPVAIVSETLAARAWPGESPLGRQVRPDGYSSGMTVVGVVRDTKPKDLIGGRDVFQLYLPLTRDEGMRATTQSLLVRFGGERNGLAARIAQLARGIEPGVTVSEASEIEQDYARGRQGPRVYLALMTIVAAIGLGTAVVGLYASTAGAVVRQSREIGIRLALGADTTRIRGALLRTALQPVVIGTFCGLTAAFWLTGFLTTMLYGVKPGDPWTMLSAATMLLSAAWVGAYVPARHISRIDPARTLRIE